MVRVIDDFLPDKIFDTLQKNIMHWSVPWSVCQTANGDSKYYIEDYQSFGCLITPSNPLTELVGVCATVANKIIRSQELQVCEPARIRLGLLTRDNIFRINGAHIDAQVPHTVALLYINDSDGDTILYRNRYDPGDETCKPVYTPDELSIYKTVSPKPNRLLVFDGFTYHSSSTPVKNQLRYAVNFNFIHNV